MAKNVDLYMDQGSDFEFEFPPVRNYDGTVVNLTGYEVTSLLRRSYAIKTAVAFTAEITNPTGGIIKLSMLNEHTAGLNATRWVYDVIITDPDEIVDRVFEGLVHVSPSVSSKPNTTLLTPYVPDDYGGI